MFVLFFFSFLSQGLDNIMASSDDYDELVWAWQGWRDEVGVANNDLYIRYVELSNEVAVANGKLWICPSLLTYLLTLVDIDLLKF